jgi:transposase-like protein
MSDETLTTEQLAVINALAEGMNMTDAAAQAGVHRNTIANWRRNSISFRDALADAQYDRAQLCRDKAEEMLDRAFQALDSVLADPKSSPSVRLKAALFIIEKVIAPPARTQNAQTVHKMHNAAQPAPVQPQSSAQPDLRPRGDTRVGPTPSTLLRDRLQSVQGRL